MAKKKLIYEICSKIHIIFSSKYVFKFKINNKIFFSESTFFEYSHNNENLNENIFLSLKIIIHDIEKRFIKLKSINNFKLHRKPRLNIIIMNIFGIILIASI